jgi:FolB domain-containing protein
MDSIEIRGLSCRCIIGIRARERRVPQHVRLDLELLLGLERAGKSGRIAHTVDYSRASTEIIALLQFRKYTLLEVAAEECAGWLFAAYPAIEGVTLRISKPQALAGQAECGGARIERRRPSEPQRGSTDFGFVASQLETADASISLVGVRAGAAFAPELVGADAALVLPIAGKLVGIRPLNLHEPIKLARGESCDNRDATLATLVVCARRSGA